MATGSSAIDDAIEYLDHLIGRMTTMKPPSSTSTSTGGSPLQASSSLHLHLQGTPTVSNSSESSGICKDARNGTTSSRVSSANKAGPDSTREKAVESNSETEEMFAKAQIQVGYVHEVSNHPISEKLFLCRVEVAKGETRQVVAGLRKFLPASELQGKKVCVVVNLKPAKLAGQLSEAMILAGEATEPNGQLTVKVLEPPPDASVGERIFIEAQEATSNPVKQLSSKVWEKIILLFKVEAGIAKFDSKPLVTSTGSVKVPEIPYGSIH